MSILGVLVKKGIEINQKLRFEPDEPHNQQEKQLRELLKTAKNTAFGKYYGFAEMLEAEDVIKAFQKEVPLFDYHQMHDEWWEKQQEHPDITWPGKPNFFALSSGTTGKSSKRIPITEEFLQSMRQVGTSLIRSVPNFDFPEELFESEILMLSSSATLVPNTQGHLEGEISGINVSNFPGWYDVFYRPGKEIAAISDWDERIRRIAEEAPNWNIGAIAGIPSWVLLMLKEVIKYHGVNNIHELWPNLTVYATGGVAFETYRKDFEAISGKPITIIDTYLASEGFFSYTARPNTLEMELALSHGYFYEFIPFDERGVDEFGNLLDQPEIHTIAEVQKDQDYVMIVSTCAGAWRYQIGDVVRFTSLDPHEIIITGRTKFYLNVVGSQLSEEKMDAAILEVADQLEKTINEYSVAAVKNSDGDYIHQWVVVSEKSIDETDFAERLDKALKDANKNYGVARSKALKGIKVKAIGKEVYYNFLAEGKKKGGQVKTPKVMGEEKMKNFMDFIQKS
jgi:hypothetical protein